MKFTKKNTNFLYFLINFILCINLHKTLIILSSACSSVMIFIQSSSICCLFNESFSITYFYRLNTCKIPHGKRLVFEARKTLTTRSSTVCFSLVRFQQVAGCRFQQFNTVSSLCHFLPARKN